MANIAPGYQFNPLTGMRKKRPRSGGFGGGSDVIERLLGRSGPAGSGGGAGYGSITTPGFTPNYESLIESALGPLRAQLGAEGSADAASRNAALTRGLGQFGEQFDPSGAQAAFGQDFYQQAGLEGLLPQANQLAQQNTQAGFSVSSKLQKALEGSVQQIQNALAGRGMLRSGAYGTALEGANQEFRQGQYDARQSLTDYLQAAQQGFTAAERARQTQLYTAGREEAVRQATLNPATGTWEAPYSGQNAPDGRPLYRGRKGELLYADGSPYTTPGTGEGADAGQALEFTGQNAPDGRRIYKRRDNGQLVYDDGTPYPGTTGGSGAGGGDLGGGARDPFAALQAALARGREQRLGSQQ